MHSGVRRESTVYLKRWFATVGLLLACSASLGCATVPAEAVTLSSAVGEDIQTIRTGYKDTVRAYFGVIRLRTEDALAKWSHAYVRDFVVRGKLVKGAQEGKTKFVEAWARIAVRDIDAERRVRMDWLDRKERALLTTIDSAFDRMTAANAAVTAHLNSVRKVQAVQDKALEAANVKGIRDEINDALVSASKNAASSVRMIDNATEELKKANGANE
jgi:hypothetical protein